MDRGRACTTLHLQAGGAVKVLVACEFSGRVRQAFRDRGHNAVSCDFETTEIPGNHYQGDVYDLLDKPWDLLIAFPPCTHLATCGARWWDRPGKREAQRQAVEFVRLLMEANIPRIAIENPIGILSTAIRKPDQIIQPWEHGHGETKSTCLWLKGLPLLVPSNVVEGRENRIHWMPERKSRAKDKSRTYPGIAAAMAEQWGGV
jgi:site-specific DNA-cytosine methylase